MAYSLNEVPESVRDILAHMPHEMQQRVLADYETHYAPFLAMLAGWKGAVQAHYAQGEESAINRLQEQFFPLGQWKFPCQGLAVPQRPTERTTDIAVEAALTDPGGRPWLSCGAGWLHPTALREGSIQMIDDDWAFIVEADYLGAGPVDALLERGQLAFVAAPEELLLALDAAQWWAVTPGRPPRRAQLMRYDGYMAFERELQTARINQRQLDLWLPPLHPYSRKIVRLSLAPAGKTSSAPPDFGWTAELRTGFRFIAVLRQPTRRAVAALRAQSQQQGKQPLFQLNPVPVVQTAVQDSIFYPPFPRLSGEYALRVSGVPDLACAVVYNDNRTVPATMIRVPSNDPAKTDSDIQVQFAQFEARTARVKLYYNSLGQERPDNSSTPSVLTMTPLRFDVPYRVIGGATVGAPSDRAEWARSAWYHSVLRPPLLTEGDIAEVIRQRKRDFGDLLRFKYATREILHDPEDGNVHWRSYLWPSLIARENSFDARYGEIPAANYVPLIQSLRLAFERGSGAIGVPEFLLADVANYLASVLSQYFVVSSFRIEGRVV